jgi:Protein of unknown function (DUF2589)
MPNPAQELSSIDFESMIGGPLCAVVRAQAMSALTTANFIKDVGFKPVAQTSDFDKQIVGDPVMVEFKYQRLVSPATPKEGDIPKKDARYEEVKLSVPLLTMVPIPYIRVADTKISFKAKIDALERVQADSSVKVDSKLDAKAGWFFGSARLQVNAVYQQETKSETKVTRSYSMDVDVNAVQDEMPGGLERLLSILEASINAVPTLPNG